MLPSNTEPLGAVRAHAGMVLRSLRAGRSYEKALRYFYDARNGTHEPL